MTPHVFALLMLKRGLTLHPHLHTSDFISSVASEKSPISDIFINLFEEVGKKLRNFSLVPKKACHCEDERSEDVAIAKSLNINEITTQSTIARNDNIRHAELADCEFRAELDGNFSLAPLRRGIKGEGLTKNKIAQQMRDDKLRHPELVSASHNETVFSRFTSHFSRKRVAFTLAEVLITLGIIGVVAVMTMPAIIANIQDHVKAKRIENIRQKLSKVTDAMSATSGINGYADTMEFVAEMNKHMKIAKICDNEHLSACWPTKEVMLNDEGKMWEIAKTKNAKTLKIPDAVLNNYTNTVGIVTADGTSMILSYDKTCDFNPEVTGYAYSGGLSNSASCLAGVFDWNGGKNPNKLGKDVITLGVASGLGNDCAFELNGKCFTAPFIPTPITRAECEELKGELGIKGCYWNSDYWAGAVKQCGGVSKMPTRNDLIELAKVLYNTSNINSSGYTRNLTLDTSKASSIGFTGSPFSVWSRDEPYSDYAYYRTFDSSGTGWYNNTRIISHIQVVCSGD